MATGASHTNIILCLLRTESVGRNPSNVSVIGCSEASYLGWPISAYRPDLLVSFWRKSGRSQNESLWNDRSWRRKADARKADAQ